MSIVSTTKYIHDSEVHNMVSPDIIVPYIVDLLHPKSAVDVGCGIGTFLQAFQTQGVQNIRGFDGAWVNIDQLHIQEKYFTAADLEQPLVSDECFDVVLCLEVAEHLKEESADVIVQSLINLGKVIVFSAAIPNQDGQNHINEQLPSYWQAKFATHGFTHYDVFREYFWNNDEVNWWYKQNMFLVVHHSVHLPDFIVEKKIIGEPLLLIHPDLYALQMRRKANIDQRLQESKANWKRAKEGKLPLKFYLRSIVKKFLKK